MRHPRRGSDEREAVAVAPALYRRLRQLGNGLSVLLPIGHIADHKYLRMIDQAEIRRDVDAEMLASMLDWLAERFQDALVSEELDPGLIHRQPERRSMRIKEFVEVLRSGIANQPEDD